MASLSLAQRGSKAITSADTSPVDVTLVSPVKLGSSLFNATVRDRRRDVLVQHGSIAITDADVSPKDSAALGTAVDTGAAYVTNVTIREKRTNNIYGATVKLNSSTVVRATFGTVAAGDTIDLEFDVVEFKARRGATARLIDEDTVRIAWDGTLAAGETIDVDWEVWDADDIGDELLEILFREQRILAYLGENMVQDMLDADYAGNIAQCRLRIFDTKANADACTRDHPGEDFQDGELARALIVQEIDKATNNRTALVRTLTAVIDTPGVD